MDPATIPGMFIDIGVKMDSGNYLSWCRFNETIEFRTDGSIRYVCDEDEYRQAADFVTSSEDIEVEIGQHLQFLHFYQIRIGDHKIYLQYPTTQEFAERLLPIMQIWTPEYTPSIIPDEEHFIPGLEVGEIERVFESQFRPEDRIDLDEIIARFDLERVQVLIKVNGGYIEKYIRGGNITVQVIQGLIREVYDQVAGRFAFSAADSYEFHHRGHLRGYCYIICIEHEHNRLVIGTES